ncbi:MAG TPA: alanine--tRNA ligase [Candidatus Acidoferrales bacterium]|nr:alanine--tRNA ligase [Candidatus Acidoferrales bacterium]
MEELKWSGNKIRETFLRFFEERGHKRVRSSSLVPANDPTLLFTNAGMNQFKDVFLGLEKRDYNRATTCQKCVRAGGKHNDLENVGFTNRHHTFFEMLGNFSFGDYFKKDAIAYAWELVTSPEWFAIPVDKLFFTVFGGHENLQPDHDAAKLWLETGAPKDRVYEIPGLKENFWAMGDTGPCGPCSEIFYDMGPAASDQGHTDCKFPCECGRYVEIWNLVFMQFNRDASGTLNPLPKPSVDTGMGLERMAAVMQGAISNYETDLFTLLIDRAKKLVLFPVAPEGKIRSVEDDLLLGEIKKRLDFARRGRERSTDPFLNNASLRVIADHSRAATFLIADGVVPSNEGRGYVLRKILRRGIRHGRLQGQENPFLYQMVYTVRDLMKDAYPELIESADRVAEVIKAEEEQFDRVLKIGLSAWEKRVQELALESLAENRISGFSSSSQDKILEFNRKGQASVMFPGKDAFRLYETYGLPLDFMVDAARDVGIQLDLEGFERARSEEQARARASWKGAHKEAASPVYRKLADTFKTEPDFYFGTTTKDCHIEAIVTKAGQVNELKAGEEAEIVLDRSTIYAESGGQVADTGAFFDDALSQQVAEVRGAYYPVAGLIAHRIVAKEDLAVGDRVATVADAARRARVMRNHTGTHLVNAALRNILGTHVKQSGSLNAPDHLRFDFSHFAQLAPEELQEIENQVNEEILRDLPLQTDIMNIDDALASGALAFFGDKYPEQNVRVVTIADSAYPRGFYSKELCGGTHVARTGEIGVFKITLEQSVAAGVRRIEALTGDAALAQYRSALGTLRTLAGMLNTGEDRVLEAVEKLEQERKQLEKQLEGLRRKSAVSQVDSLLEAARMVKNVRVVAAKVENADREALRQLADGLRQKMGSGVVVLAAGEPARDGGESKVSLITAVTKDLTNRLHAGKMVQEIAKLLGGSGGGRPDLAEAGGRDVAGIETALAQVYPLVERLV